MARVLVVDDESNIRLMVRIALQASGHVVEVAADGAEALAKFAYGAGWDLVLLDQRMPGMEGLEVLEEMRRRAPAARVVMITAFGTIDLATSAMRAGATDFLRKPFTTHILRGAIQAALEDAPVAAVVGPERPATGVPIGAASINGFRITSSNGAGAQNDGSVRHSFTVCSGDGQTSRCEVVLPAFFTELVKAHADRDHLPDAEHFWLWLCEEALANYLWQNAELPPGGVLQVDELTTALRRWVDAVLT
jgi:DNA-binding response OmpR family regulator